MIKQIRKLWKSQQAKARKIYNLQAQGLLKVYIDNGYKAYDTEEFAQWKGKKQGRPLKENNNE